VDLNLDTTTVLNVLIGSYTFKTDFTRGTYTIAAAIPFGYADIDATITGAGGTRIRASEDSFHLSDIFLTPVQLGGVSGLASTRR
jgi:hypothetical protein